MPILRKPKHEKFTMVMNYFINDTRLKPDGKGVLLFMLSKPDDWNFKYENLMAGLGIGEKYLRSCIKQLEELKYIKRIKCRGENGHYAWNYFIYEEPYDMELKKDNLPGIPSGNVVEGDILDGNNILSTKKLSTKKLIDKNDKLDKTGQGLINEEIEHNVLTKELINLNYIDCKDELSSIYFDYLFSNYLLNGKTYKELFSAIHYIAPRVVERKFIDEDGNKIVNRYGYFKNAIESNFTKLENLGKDLYDENFFKDFEFNERGVIE